MSWRQWKVEWKDGDWRNYTERKHYRTIPNKDAAIEFATDMSRRNTDVGVYEIKTTDLGQWMDGNHVDEAPLSDAFIAGVAQL